MGRRHASPALVCLPPRLCAPAAIAMRVPEVPLCGVWEQFNDGVAESGQLHALSTAHRKWVYILPERRQCRCETRGGRHIGNLATTRNDADALPPPGPSGALPADRFVVAAPHRCPRIALSPRLESLSQEAAQNVHPFAMGCTKNLSRYQDLS